MTRRASPARHRRPPRPRLRACSVAPSRPPRPLGHPRISAASPARQVQITHGDIITLVRQSEAKAEFAFRFLAAGGSVANCASTLASLETYGVDAHCSVGDDAFGRFLLDYFRQNSVGTSYVSVSSKHPTSTACLPVYKKDGKRAVYCAQGWNAHFVPHVDVYTYDAILLGYPHVMPSLRGAPLARFAAQCVERGTCLCLDVNEACDDYEMLQDERHRAPVRCFSVCKVFTG